MIYDDLAAEHRLPVEHPTRCRCLRGHHPAPVEAPRAFEHPDGSRYRRIHPDDITEG